MATASPVNGWTLPEDTDAANIETAVQTPLLQVDQRVIPIFASVAARATALAAPVAGQHCYVSATGENYVYNGTAWVSASPRWVIKSGDTARVNNTVSSDPHLTIALEASSTYNLKAKILVLGSSVASVDFQCNWTYSGTKTDRGRLPFGGDNASTNASATTIVLRNFGLGTAVEHGTQTSTGHVFVEDLLFETTTAGTLAFQWAQAVTNAASTTVAQGSTIECWKVA